MRMIYVVFVFLITCGLILFLMSCNNKSTPKEESNTDQISDSSKVKGKKLEENPYPRLRNQSLSVTPEQLQLKLDEKKIVAYGVVMDWDIEKAVATVVAFQTGDASLYLNTGQIFIGGYGHENIKNAAMALVSESQQYLPAAKPTTETPMPDKGCVRFYFLTNKGKYFIQETVKDLEGNKNDLSKLFGLGNNVITQYRTSVEERKANP